MSEPGDGGAAFPGKMGINFTDGMSLRDYFAAAPMSDVELETLREAFSKRFPAKPLSIARLRYWRADTMLETRQQLYDKRPDPIPLNATAPPPEQTDAPLDLGEDSEQR